MKQKGLFMMAAACMLAATSCSQDQVAGSSPLSGNEIDMTARIGGDVKDVRAVETKITNLGKFTVNAFQAGEANHMKNVEYTTSNNGSSWTTAAGKFFWPVEGDLHLYGYAPAKPGAGGTFKLDKDAQTLTGFVPFTTAAAQQDFVYAKSTGNNAANGTTGVEMNFQHALTEISIAAKNSNTAYTVKVTGVKLGNVKTKGTFTFPSVANSAASWSLSSAAEDVGSYETTWSNATVLDNSVSTLDEANVPFMLIPQQLEKSGKAFDKAYLALKVNITMQGGKVIRDGWAYIGLDTNWEMGKHYTYTVDFSDGAGQDENGKQLISGKEMTLNVKVTPWNEKSVDLPEKVISGTASGDFNCKLGGMDGISFKVYPDASGNWMIPVTKLIGVTGLQNMFQDCRSLKSLDMRGCNTEIINNMSSMCYNCDYLTSLDVNGWNTENVTKMNDMFYGCERLTNLDVSHFHTEKVTDMGAMFGNCYCLNSLNLSGWDTRLVTNMRGIFYSCKNLTAINLSNWNTSKVNSMHYMFYNCQKLSSLDLRHFNTEKVTDMGSMFESCNNLVTLNLKGWNTSNVTDMRSMFDMCYKLTSLDVHHFNTGNVTNMYQMFRDCHSLTTLDLSNWNTGLVTDMRGMFSGCRSLTGLDLSHFNIKKVTNVTSMFSWCWNLTSLDLSGWDMSNVTNMSNMFKESTSLKTIRMVGCNEATINKIKTQLATDGIKNVTIVTE